jgi:hypothetical protein
MELFAAPKRIERPEVMPRDVEVADCLPKRVAAVAQCWTKIEPRGNVRHRTRRIVG